MIASRSSRLFRAAALVWALSAGGTLLAAAEPSPQAPARHPESIKPVASTAKVVAKPAPTLKPGPALKARVSLDWQVNQLTKQVEALQKMIRSLHQEIWSMRKQLTRIGILVTPPVCLDNGHQVRLGGDSKTVVECAPYACDPVANDCRTSCNRTDDCGGGSYVCDPSDHVCKPTT